MHLPTLCKFKHLTLFNIICNFAARSSFTLMKPFEELNNLPGAKNYIKEDRTNNSDVETKVQLSDINNDTQAEKEVRSSYSLLQSKSEIKVPCSFDEHLCDNGECIKQVLICDGNKDCLDGKDEINCPEKKTCPDRYSKCGNGDCIPNKYLCDGLKHCLDGFDEENCGGSTPKYEENPLTELREVTSEKAALPSDVQKLLSMGLQQRRFQGGKIDRPVPDINNEITESPPELGKEVRSSFSLIENETESEHCEAGFFKCGNGNCVQAIFRCDGQKHCADGADEFNCTEITECPDGYTKCVSGGCIPMKFLCDGLQHCLDGTDEENCFVYHVGLPIPRSFDVPAGAKCKSGNYQCGNGQCIPVSYVCDGKKHCADGLDEKFCFGKLKSLIPVFHEEEDETETENKCVQGNFQCTTEKCLDVKLLCNGFKNCEDGLDEQNCYFGCRIGNFQCKNNKECIDVKHLCNGFDNCQDGSDEFNCYVLGHIDDSKKQQRTFGCRVGNFQCRNEKCLEINKVCNGDVDCSDGTDEENCFNYLSPKKSDGKSRRFVKNDFNKTSSENMQPLPPGIQNLLSKGLTQRRFQMPRPPQKTAPLGHLIPPRVSAPATIHGHRRPSNPTSAYQFYENDGFQNSPEIQYVQLNPKSGVNNDAKTRNAHYIPFKPAMDHSGNLRNGYYSEAPGPVTVMKRNSDGNYVYSNALPSARYEFPSPFEGFPEMNFLP